MFLTSRMSMGILIPFITVNHKTLFSKTLVYRKTLTTTKPQFSHLIILNCKTSSEQFSSAKTNSNKKTTVQFDDINRNSNLKIIVFEKLKNKNSDPLQILEDDGDWSKELFWAVVGFLNQTSRSNHVLQVFDKWSSKDESRISVVNYERIVRLLVDEGLVEDAVLALKKMKDVHGLRASSEIYNSIINGFVDKGKFDDALFHLKEMEDNEMKPLVSTYNGLIRAYAKNGLYDDMAKCVKRMETNGCFPHQSTYNLLIREFSIAGLIKRMDRTYRIVISKRMDLEESTMVAMLEAYANFGDLEMMKKVYRRVLRLKPKVYLNDDLIRKVAAVYIENYLFSKLHDMGINLYSKTGDNNIVWCLRMLSPACLLSRAGMESVVREMGYKKVRWTVTIANIMLFAYAKMKDKKDVKVVLLEMAARNVKPDIVTCGIWYDALGFGFDEIDELRSVGVIWKKMGFLGDVVEFKTDPLVLVAFGKGNFLNTVEELDHTKNKIWTYEELIKLVKQYQHGNR